jgi:hypothetical protein
MSKSALRLVPLPQREERKSKKKLLARAFFV